MLKAEQRLYRFSANLGFLWTHLPLDEAIIRAADAGFDAVECHWPYDMPASQIADALEATGLSMLGINARCGDRAAGEFG
jgi:hydroxypyruvate isomerase